MPDIESLTSSSGLKESSITVKFGLSTDMETVINSVRSKISDAQKTFPSDCDSTTIDVTEEKLPF